MTGLAKKLNIKAHIRGLLIGLPEELSNLPEAIASESQLNWLELPSNQTDFVLCFVKNAEDLAAFCGEVYPKLNDSVLLWMAYPKKSSRRFQSEINRDAGWEPLGKLELEPVRQISLSEDWSALRFRPVDQINKLNRRKEMAISSKGKARSR